jgi:hypothetical protein
VRLETLGAGELLAGLPGRAPLHDKEGKWCAYLGIGAVEEAVQALASGWDVGLSVYNVTRKSAPLHTFELRRHELSADELLCCSMSAARNHGEPIAAGDTAAAASRSSVSVEAAIGWRRDAGGRTAKRVVSLCRLGDPLLEEV